METKDLISILKTEFSDIKRLLMPIMSTPKSPEKPILKTEISTSPAINISCGSDNKEEHASFQDSLHSTPIGSPNKSSIYQSADIEKECLWENIGQLTRHVRSLTTTIREIEAKSEKSLSDVTLVVDKATALFKKDRVLKVERDLHSLESALTRIGDSLRLLTELMDMYDTKLIAYNHRMNTIESKLDTLCGDS